MKELTFKRIVILIIDGMGVGSLPDSKMYGDINTSCLDDVLEKEGGAEIPTLLSLGIGKIARYFRQNNSKIIGHYGRVQMKSKFKDSWAGHWEIAGVKVNDESADYVDVGFPDEIIKKFESETHYRVLGNEAIIYREEAIDKLIESHKAEKDSVIVLTEQGKETVRTFSIYALIDNMPIDDLYSLSMSTKQVLHQYNHIIGRIGSRPLVYDGQKLIVPHALRKDFLMFEPPKKTLLTNLADNNIGVYTAGKVSAMFQEIGISENRESRTNDEVYDALCYYLKSIESGLVFVTFNDMDCMYATARDSYAWKCCLEDVDKKIDNVIRTMMHEDDLLIIAADGHGADPVFTGLHTREYSPLLVYHKNIKQPKHIENAKYLHDIQATVSANFSVPSTGYGHSFLYSIV